MVALAASTAAMAAGEPTEQQLKIAEPLVAPWTGPYGGVPPFDKVKVDAIGPALEVGMARNLAEIELIATNPEAPTFENTIAALEDTGRALSRAGTVYGVYSSTMSDDAVQAVERDMAPKLAAFQDQITQNEPLFKRIAAVYDDAREVGPHARAATAHLVLLHEPRACRRAARPGSEEAHG